MSFTKKIATAAMAFMLASSAHAGDTDIAVGLLNHRPRGQLGAGGMAGLMARWQQRGHRQVRQSSLPRSPDHMPRCLSYAARIAGKAVI